MSAPSTKIAPLSGRSSWLMQRRNVLLPEPEGPMMHDTSPRGTSSETPASACSAPKYLCTSTAVTIASMRSGPLRLERHDGLRAPLAAALREVSLQKVLADLEHRNDDEVPDGGDDQELDDARVGVVDRLRVAQALGVADDALDRGQLANADDLVADRWDDDAHRLRQHDAAKGGQPGHADRLRGLGLAEVDGEDAGAHDLGRVGALADAEAQERRHERRHHVDGAGLEQPGNAEPREDERQVEPDQQLQQQRRAAEEPDVE